MTANSKLLGAADPSPAVATHVDWQGLALDLESCAEKATSQTAERAIRAGANGLRLLAAAPAVAVPASLKEQENAAFWAAEGYCLANALEIPVSKLEGIVNAVLAAVVSASPSDEQIIAAARAASPGPVTQEQIAIYLPVWRAFLNAIGATPSAARAASDVRQQMIDWAAERWHAEVANRPLVNIHRRSLDDTWRQVLRRLGVDDRARLGPTHDELLAEAPCTAAKTKGADLLPPGCMEQTR